VHIIVRRRHKRLTEHNFGILYLELLAGALLAGGLQGFCSQADCLTDFAR
jgi:hypothetical protein